MNKLHALSTLGTAASKEKSDFAEGKKRELTKKKELQGESQKLKRAKSEVFAYLSLLVLVLYLRTLYREGERERECKSVCHREARTHIT